MSTVKKSMYWFTGNPIWKTKNFRVPVKSGTIPALSLQLTLDHPYIDHYLYLAFKLLKFITKNWNAPHTAAIYPPLSPRYKNWPCPVWLMDSPCNPRRMKNHPVDQTIKRNTDGRRKRPSKKTMALHDECIRRWPINRSSSRRIRSGTLPEQSESQESRRNPQGVTKQESRACVSVMSPRFKLSNKKQFNNSKAKKQWITMKN